MVLSVCERFPYRSEWHRNTTRAESEAGSMKLATLVLLGVMCAAQVRPYEAPPSGQCSHGFTPAWLSSREPCLPSGTICHDALMCYPEQPPQSKGQQPSDPMAILSQKNAAKCVWLSYDGKVHVESDPKQCDVWPAPEAEDVPAIQVKKSVRDGEAVYCGLQMCYPWQLTHEPTYTFKLAMSCADKSRVLWHDENDPPKYYCHRVKP